MNAAAQPSAQEVARLHREAILAEAAISTAKAHAEECHARLAAALTDGGAANAHREASREHARQASLIEKLAADAWPGTSRDDQ